MKSLDILTLYLFRSEYDRMILAINIGNSNIAYGVFHNQNEDVQLLSSFRASTINQKNCEEQAELLYSNLKSNGIQTREIDNIIIGSVVPSFLSAFNTSISRIFTKNTYIVQPDMYRLLPIKVIAPFEIGVDLVADALAAYNKYKSACIVVDFGTALTFTAVNENGDMQGVAIAPGLSIAMRSLFRDTALLPEVPLRAPESVMGINSIQSLQSGIVFGFADLTVGLVNRMKESMGKSAKVIATGGNCQLMSPIVKIFDDVDIDLNLKGLAYIGYKVHEAGI